MSKFRMLAQKCAATAATAATFGSNTVATLFSQSSNTVAALLPPIVRRISRLKTFFFSRVSSNSSNTFPNFAQEIEKEGFGRILVDDREPIYHNPYESDEFDHEDYDEWWYEQDYPGIDDSWDPSGQNWSGVTNASWTQRAVDEIIAEEQSGEHPPSAPTFNPDDENPWDGLFGKNRFPL